MDDHFAEGLEPDEEEKLRILQRLLATQESGRSAPSAAPSSNSSGSSSGRQVSYEPGICLKTRNTVTGAKCFINLCQSPHLPQPPEATDEQLARLLEDPDSHAARFRVPLSIGDPHAERDNSGTACTAFDIVAHPSLLERMRQSELYRGFVLGLALEGVEAKHGLQLCRESMTLLRNKKYIGSVTQQAAQHFVRPAGAPPKPIIQEVPQSQLKQQQNSHSNRPAESQQQQQQQPPRPEFRLLQEPPYGQPSHFVCEARLPLVTSAESLQLQVGGDRLLLTCRSRAYRLDFYLPRGIDQEGCRAQFDTDSRVLTVTMPVDVGSA